MKLLRTIPALPVKDIGRSVEFYRDKLGFALVHQEGGFAVLRRDDAEIHLWAASDERWRGRTGAASPVVSGAESFIAGTASCRVEVVCVDELYVALQPMDVFEPNSQITDQWWGSREFDLKDPDNNLVTFFENR